MPTEQFNAPSQERQPTRFESGDQLDLHMRSEHVRPYEAPQAIEPARMIERAQTPESLKEHEQVALVGKYVAALRRGELDPPA